MLSEIIVISIIVFGFYYSMIWWEKSHKRCKVSQSYGHPERDKAFNDEFFTIVRRKGG